jgi:hypothetical protein
VLVVVVVVVVVVVPAVSFLPLANLHEIKVPSFGAQPKHKDHKFLQKQC